MGECHNPWMPVVAVPWTGRSYGIPDRQNTFCRIRLDNRTATVIH